ncbi:hypothetical protein D6C85_08241 [Aureobasidium pullulans]|uniref:Uncharacterized protein n=1 Tax=Aureobasidium pullulans TaxID=5580 RepID=A0A4V6TIV1_AURPU|nr:hypothetical protein D6C85_08241 [Aureobasidium pullulans]
MVLLIDLPPELRMTIWDSMLQKALVSEKRIVYCDDDGQHDESPECSDDDIPSSMETVASSPIVGWSRIAMQYDKNHQGRFISLVDVRYRYGPSVLKRAVHHANIDALLALASTCRKIRSEVLALAWGNADITIYAPDNGFKADVMHMFGRCLSEETCSLIRTLHVDVGKPDWSCKYVNQMAHFINKRLPNLETLTIAVARTNTQGRDIEVDKGLQALNCLPFTILLEIMAYIHPEVVAMNPPPPMIVAGSGHRVSVTWEESQSWNDNMYYKLRSSARLFARALQTQNNERHADGSLLEDTIGMRSGMAGWPVIACQVAPKERWEFRAGGNWRNSFKVREGVEVVEHREKQAPKGLFMGPWLTKATEGKKTHAEHMAEQNYQI